MQKYEAAEKFLEMVKNHPDDFFASLDSGRDHNVYTISNMYRAVSINIDTHSGRLDITGAPSGKCIMYAEESVLEELYNWAIGHIAAAKIQDQVNKDNSAMYELFKYYEEKEQC